MECTVEHAEEHGNVFSLQLTEYDLLILKLSPSTYEAIQEYNP